MPRTVSSPGLKRHGFCGRRGFQEGQAVKCRKLIRESDRSQWGAPFCKFPYGSCGAVAEMFGTYLCEECGVENANLVSANHCDGLQTHGSHAWLELSDLIVDLTCDQFPEAPCAPYVGKDRTWYSQWDVEKRTSMKTLLERDHDRIWSDWGAAYNDLQEKLD